jgi:TonB family protein
MGPWLFLPVLASTVTAPLWSGFAFGSFGAEKVTQEGYVRVSVIVGRDRRVERCEVIDSTAPQMNEATCRILAGGARFTRPPKVRTKDGSWITTVRVVYRIAGEPQPSIRQVRKALPPSSLPSSVPSPLSLTRPATLIDPERRMATDADYPAEASATGEEGTTGFRLAIDQQGAVTSCSITKTSGSASLDAATCRLAMDRLRFRSATDDSGKPKAGSWTSALRWVLPRTPLPKPRR